MDKKRRYSLILAIGCIVFAGIAGIAINMTRQRGSQIIVWADGTQWGIYQLNQEQEIEIKTENGRNILRIQDGKAKMTEADCPDGLCIRQREIDKIGESIICLPHRIVVEVIGDAQEDQNSLDAVVN